jgi:hypothetical protein
MPVTWETVFLLGACAWLAIQERERIVRFAFVLLGLGPASRILLAAVHASVETRTVNAEVMRGISLVVWAGGCFYIVQWYQQRLKRVRQLPNGDPSAAEQA